MVDLTLGQYRHLRGSGSFARFNSILGQQQQRAAFEFLVGVGPGWGDKLLWIMGL